MAFDLPVTRSEQTEADYRKRFAALTDLAAREFGGKASLEKTVDWFLGQDDRWRRTTIAQYRAALKIGIQDMEAQGLLSAEASADLLKRIQNGPARKVHGTKLTSSRKRKSVSDAEIDLLAASLKAGAHQHDRLLRLYLAFSIMFFPRPSEWRDAHIDGEDLVVINGKVSNRRAHGPDRRIGLDCLAKREREVLQFFLASLQAEAKVVGTYARLQTLLAARLVRHCQKAGVRRVSLYTLRHLGMATAKRFLAPEEVAALAGHATDRTATEHYAKARYGRRAPAVLPRANEADIARVRKTGRAAGYRASRPKPSL
jgi:integrase